MEYHSSSETQRTPENPPHEELLESSHQLTKRIITLCKNSNSGSFNSEIFIDGNMSDDDREDKTALITECGNGFGLVIKRLETVPEHLTEVNIIFYPHDWERVNYLEGIESGLAEEYVKKQRKSDRETLNRINRELKKRGPKGVSLSHLTVSFTGDANSLDKCRPVLTRLSLILSDNTTIGFDPLMNYEDMREESGPYARMVFKRFLDRLSDAVEEEEKYAISMLLNNAIRRTMSWTDGTKDQGPDEVNEDGPTRIKPSGDKKILN